MIEKRLICHVGEVLLDVLVNFNRDFYKVADIQKAFRSIENALVGVFI